MSVSIRAETEADEAEIRALVSAAFDGHAHSEGVEPEIIERLRRERTPTLSLVAEAGDVLLGLIVFSPVSISDGTRGWFGLGPLAVAPDRQRGGIGSALCEAGLTRLREQGAGGCVVLGDPDYYGRFGFAHDPELVFPGVPQEYFQRLLFAGDEPRGTVSYAPAFG
ncbi:GNAT family N-acetyltransferase [Aurantiacibacter sp. MUD61]|uniref:GNAT family N-acetyltransferase n=1 Tax=Aurantiacibacter sp. MUD61 TaxID=3009083 RepID=UPI0022F04383|nr:N-acetyltransferase [Aurantiacibacter sp. MUD61]